MCENVCHSWRNRGAPAVIELDTGKRNRVGTPCALFLVSAQLRRLKSARELTSLLRFHSFRTGHGDRPGGSRPVFVVTWPRAACSSDQGRSLGQGGSPPMTEATA